MNDLDQMIKKQEQLMKIYPEDQDIKKYHDQLVFRVQNIRKRELEIH